jgi:hypothetical protein
MLISCNGNEVQVTKNLYEALRRLRRESEERTLWIDALCINQSDIAERNSQVGIMSNIYRCAPQGVVVWLGEEDTPIDQGMTLLKELGLVGQNLLELHDTKSIWEEMGRINISSFEVEACTQIRSILARPWFNRIWVVQEIALPRVAVIQCGKYQLDWLDMESALEIISRIGYGYYLGNLECGILYLSVYRRLHNENRDRVDMRKNSMKIESLLIENRWRQATEPVDMVYSLLGLAEDVAPATQDGMVIPIDYSSDIYKIFIGVATTHIKHYDTLLLLSAAGLDESWDPKFPTWCPNWSAKRNYRPIMEGSSFVQYNASMGENAGATIDSNNLTIKGLAYDKIVETGQSYGEMAFGELMFAWRALAEKHKLFSKTDSTAFRLTISVCEKQQSELESKQAEEIFWKWWRFICEGEDIHTVMATVDGEDASAEGEFDFTTNSTVLGFQANVAMICEHRRLIITENGHLGLAPFPAKVGDLVVIANGSIVPLILRRSEEAPAEVKDAVVHEGHDEKYILVGDAYVAGIMFGEGYDETRIREFVLN